MDTEREGQRKLERVRGEIDEIDAALVTLIRDRVRLAMEAADSKVACGREMRDVAREVEVIRRAVDQARELGVDDEPVRDLFWRLIDLSHRTVGRGE